MLLRILVCALFLVLSACGVENTPITAADTTSTAPASAPENTLPYQNISPVDFAEKMGEEDIVILDVRTPAEIAAGDISGAVHLDYRAENFAAQLEELPEGKTYLVYCASGGRSGKACEKLSELGHDKLYNLDGGYRAWVGN